MRISKFFIYRDMLYKVDAIYVTTEQKDDWTYHRYLIKIKNITHNYIAQYDFKRGIAFDAKPNEDLLHSAIGSACIDAMYLKYDTDELANLLGYSFRKTRHIMRDVASMYVRLVNLGFKKEDIERFAKEYSINGKVSLEFVDRIPKRGSAYEY